MWVVSLPTFLSAQQSRSAKLGADRPSAEIKLEKLINLKKFAPKLLHPKSISVIITINKYDARTEQLTNTPA